MRCFIEFDKAGAEWIVVAYLSGDANMIAICESGESPHVHTGSLMTGVPKEIILAEHKLLETSTDPIAVENARRTIPELAKWEGWLPRSMSIRQMGKKSNHALNYDMSHVRAALEWEVEEAEAKQIIRLYREVAYPGVPLWHEFDVRAQLRKDRTLVNLLGRKYIFRDAWGDDLFKEAYAYIPQSTIADLVLRAMIALYRDPQVSAKSELLTQTHDSFLAQINFTSWEEVAEFVYRALDSLDTPLTAKGRTFRVGTDFKVGPSWGHMQKATWTPDVAELATRLAAAYEVANGQQRQASE